MAAALCSTMPPITECSCHKGTKMAIAFSSSGSATVRDPSARKPFRRSQAHKHMALRTRSSSPLARTASAAGKRQAATKVSSADHTDAKTDTTHGSSEHRSKISNWFRRIQGPEYTSAMRSIGLSLLLAVASHGAGIDARVKHGYADSNGVKIHYASLGTGPLIVMIHGFPDFWYTWRDQMAALSDSYQCVAIDQRGYNLSDKPKGVENYDMRLLVGDVIAVIKSLGQEKAIIVGHDWGGMVAWQLALNVPQMVDRLIILNLPHPRGLSRELANNPAQQKASAYARNFQKPDASVTAEQL